jgi:outer membrane protein assembly factor BamB
MATSVLAGDLFLMGDRAGYGITRSQGGACFAIAPSSIARENVNLHAMIPGVFRLPAQVVRSFDAGFAIVRVGEDSTACEGERWEDGAHLEVALTRTGIGSLEIRPGDGALGRMHVHVDEIDADGFFAISPVVESDRLMEGMSGSRVLIEDNIAGLLLSVDETKNSGRVIRQDNLNALVAPFFDSLSMDAELTADADAGDAAGVDASDVAKAEETAADVDTGNASTVEDTAAGVDADDDVTADYAADEDEVGSMVVDDAVVGDAVVGDAVAGNVLADTELADRLQTKPRPEILHRFFIGKQTWRNNPKIVGTRLFVGSSGREWNKPDPLDGVYSFDLITGEQVWFVHTDNDANDLTYIKGIVVAGTDSGEVLGIGARSGKTYWTRKFDGKVYARPVSLPTGVAIATSIGGLYVLNLKDGSTRASSRLDAGVRAGLVAAKGDLWVATESGTLYRYVGFGDVQIRRRSRIFYPDAFGKKLSGIAIDWYKRLGQGRGRRAKFYSAPLVVDDRIILSVVRDGQYEYPPVMAFGKNGGLDWIGTDPDGYINGTFGDSRLTPASWHNHLIFADPYSNSIYSLSSDNGEVLWATDLGRPTYQHWASPVVGDDYVYVARHDGFLHKLRANDGKRIWSMYFGQYALAGESFLQNEPLPNMNSDPEWSSQLSSPIFSTPDVSKDTIVVGTDEGYVYIIRDVE